MADETKQYTVEEFAASIKEEYPQCEDVDKMLEKYPVYQDKVVKKKRANGSGWRKWFTGWRFRRSGIDIYLERDSRRV